jgi:hypothetical protein
MGEKFALHEHGCRGERTRRERAEERARWPFVPGTFHSFGYGTTRGMCCRSETLRGLNREGSEKLLKRAFGCIATSHAWHLVVNILGHLILIVTWDGFV